MHDSRAPFSVALRDDDDEYTFMPIMPLPVYEADADPANRDAMTDAEIYARLEAPKTLVVKFGAMKLVGEFTYDGDVKPGCGTKMVARTHRGTELVEMLTTTCDNSGCNKSITRKEMLEYIENSGGKDFPFHTNGRVIRVANIDDLNRMSELNNHIREWVKHIRRAVEEHRLIMKVMDVEPILGEEVLTVYYMSEDRVDFRELVRDLAAHFKTRIEMRQVGARDEARLVADYERCGQHCCCKNFLKVLTPVSMRAAKVQKATLDTLKISGRCGRLMCCLRYEDQTYKELKARLPHRKTRVGTPHGPGLVMDSKILAQLVLVRLEHDESEVAVPLENLSDPETCPRPGETAKAMAEEAESEREAQGRRDLRQRAKESSRSPAAEDDPLRGLSPEEVAERTDDTKRRRRRRGRRGRSRGEQQDQYREKSQQTEGEAASSPDSQSSPSSQKGATPADAGAGGEGAGKKRRRGGKRRRRGGRKRRGGGAPGGEGGSSPSEN